ncbi:MAG: hypothetical protein M5T61_20935 [Acidimicrobiia bacterium]|nr:hypothetical protein [Acidimicrobiia bacterium]
MTACDVFMDVVTRVPEGLGAGCRTPTSAAPFDSARPLQFSLNIPSIKAGYINGHEHLFSQFQKWGTEFRADAVPSPAMAIGTLEVHMLELLEAYGGIANGGV